MKNSVFILVLSLLQVSFSSGQQDNLLANQEKTQNNQDRFEELAKRYKSFQEKYYAEKPDQNEDQFKRFLQQHPMNSMVQEFHFAPIHQRRLEIDGKFRPLPFRYGYW